MRRALSAMGTLCEQVSEGGESPERFIPLAAAALLRRCRTRGPRRAAGQPRPSKRSSTRPSDHAGRHEEPKALSDGAGGELPSQDNVIGLSVRPVESRKLWRTLALGRAVRPTADASARIGAPTVLPVYLAACRSARVTPKQTRPPVKATVTTKRLLRDKPLPLGPAHHHRRGP